MQTLNLTRIRLGAAALGLAALLFAAFPIVRPFFPAPDVGSPASLTTAARALASPAWVLGHFMAMAGFVLLVFGLLTLYVRLADTPAERRAFLAMLLGLAGIALILPTLGGETYALPAVGKNYLAGQTDAFAAVIAMYGGPDVLVLLVGLLLMAIGAVVLATAIWQSSALPKWAGVLLTIGLALWCPLFPQLIRIVDGALVGLGGLWLAGSIWAGPARAAQPGRVAEESFV
jgi:hypothetical protein